MITPRIIQQLHEEIALMDRKSFDDFIKTLEKIYTKTHMTYCELCEKALQDADYNITLREIEFDDKDIEKLKVEIGFDDKDIEKLKVEIEESMKGENK